MRGAFSPYIRLYTVITSLILQLSSSSTSFVLFFLVLYLSREVGSQFLHPLLGVGAALLTRLLHSVCFFCVFILLLAIRSLALGCATGLNAAYQGSAFGKHRLGLRRHFNYLTLLVCLVAKHFRRTREQLTTYSLLLLMSQLQLFYPDHIFTGLAFQLLYAAV
jgi:hypothetical protein